jgi:hypothetical protein
LLLFGVAGLVIAPGQGLLTSLAAMGAIPAAPAALGLAAWQWQLTSMSSHQRRFNATCAGIATAVYTGVAVLIFLLHSGFID